MYPEEFVKSKGTYLSGQDGRDVKPYQIEDVQDALKELGGEK